MTLPIELVAGFRSPVWVVHAYGLSMKFADQLSAEQYAAKLEERVSAPHALPFETRKHWTVEHSRMLRGA